MTSGTGALADADAEGIAAGQIALDESLVHDGGAAATDLAGGTGVALVEIAAGEDADAEGGEETGADGVEVDVAIGHDAAIGLDGHWVAPASAGEERQSGQRRRSARRARRGPRSSRRRTRRAASARE